MCIPHALALVSIHLYLPLHVSLHMLVGFFMWISFHPPLICIFHASKEDGGGYEPKLEREHASWKEKERERKRERGLYLAS